MTAHIIHNIARADRLANITKQADEQGFEFEIHAATIDEDNPVRGCHLSHRKIVQMAKDEGLPYVWLMEDDCVFTAPGAADWFVNEKPYPCARTSVHTGGVYGTHKVYFKGSCWWLLHSMSGTHCYIVYQNFYDTFLNMDENEHLDVAISKETEKLNALIPQGTASAPDSNKFHLTMPAKMIALQMPGYSDILKKDTDYNNDRYLWQYELWKGEDV